ncbi:TlyA family RNA methyltransferase [Alteribacillus iranensis]|uniref:23S rRNA (Cytidine1920-2'-O)/16S rRNA (Cytidine1409-2'-O)-methyltransferase n=1 Tax=Alteribacillus iranensis TaxID=930128 RepID=A0A1I1ZHQ4_9BACI|nr:TlyA family RNA methyltransferase [Alteribacillus iranensis]SFE31276.1 23S rRNA (cytidine1920-2'-O)/16S rRNA (cytidine1409-2'-O)-methyltransferase [Alteribacillus iranensis]
MKKERVDILLVEQGFFETREQAKRSIMAGQVYMEEERVDKPGTKIDRTASLQVKGKKMPYVSRGGLKLEKALRVFHFHVEGKIVLDIGSSTGGFTDCSLQHGARRVFAVDVGYNQLAWKLRNHSQVEVMERYNFRHASPEDFNEKPEVAVADVSFISLKLLLPPLTNILAENSDICLLIKPQFEAGREKVGKKGIVRDPNVHREVIEDIISFSASQGFHPVDIDYSPITGGDGNIEFLLHLLWEPVEKRSDITDARIDSVIQTAHAHF